MGASFLGILLGVRRCGLASTQSSWYSETWTCEIRVPSQQVMEPKKNLKTSNQERCLRTAQTLAPLQRAPQLSDLSDAKVLGDHGCCGILWSGSFTDRVSPCFTENLWIICGSWWLWWLSAFGKITLMSCHHCECGTTWFTKQSLNAMQDALIVDFLKTC